MAQILTGHFKLNAYLQTIGFSKTSFCDCNHNKVEDLDHFIFHCEKFDHLRNSMKFVSSVLFLPWPFNIELIVANDHLYEAIETFVIASRRLDY